MRRDRGFTMVQLGLALAIIVALGVIGYLVKSYLDGVDKKAFDRGVAEERAKWQGRESEELARANLAIGFLNEQYRKREAAFALEINGLAAKHEEERRNAKIRHDRDVAAVRDGFRLRDPGAATACESPGGGATAPAVATTGQPDAARGGELSAEASGFLLAEANRADAVVEKLHEVQNLAMAYWKSCGAEKEGPPAGGPASPGGNQPSG